MGKIRIFTDGACSKNPGPGGWAIVINLAIGCKTISGGENPTTNNRMELKAVIEALKLIVNKAKNGTKTQYNIYSDSAYVVNSINNRWIDVWQINNWTTTKGKDVKNKDLWKEFNDLWNKVKANNINIKLHKVKGHAGNSFNELADKLAKEEAQKVVCAND